jgi:ABC-2 type transport system ATP-binding protein
VTNSTAIGVRDVRKRFANTSVFDGLNLEVPAGSIFALVGANGAGKTTCIKMLLDFAVADAGTITLFGDHHRRSASRSRLAFLPERFLPPHHLTGFEFLDYTARLYGNEPDRERAANAAVRLDLDPGALRRPARSYSKGMAQKLGLASCLMSGKELLILDEPMDGLDPKARLLVKSLMGELRAQGRGVFFSTHVLADAQAVCDQLAILHRGKARFSGSPRQCMARYGGQDLEQAYFNCIDSACS